VLSATSGEQLAALDAEDVAQLLASKDNTLRALKQFLAKQLGHSRFQQRTAGGWSFCWATDMFFLV